MIFRTTDYSKGWDGTYNGKLQDRRNLCCSAQAIDYKENYYPPRAQ
jgi:hypothetical protein